MNYQPLLERGVHELTLEEVHNICVEGFAPKEGRREHLFVQLTDFLIYFRGLGFIPDAVWIDGSFVTTKPDPGDIDLLITINMGEVQRLPRHVQDLVYAEFSSKTREKFGCEALIAPSTDSDLIKHHLKLFSNLSRNNTYKKKGLIKIKMS